MSENNTTSNGSSIIDNAVDQVNATIEEINNYDVNFLEDAFKKVDALLGKTVGALDENDDRNISSEEILDVLSSGVDMQVFLNKLDPEIRPVVAETLLNFKEKAEEIIDTNPEAVRNSASTDRAEQQINDMLDKAQSIEKISNVVTQSLNNLSDKIESFGLDGLADITDKGADFIDKVFDRIKGHLPESVDLPESQEMLNSGLFNNASVVATLERAAEGNSREAPTFPPATPPFSPELENNETLTVQLDEAVSGVEVSSTQGEGVETQQLPNNKPVAERYV